MRRLTGAVAAVVVAACGDPGVIGPDASGNTDVPLDPDAMVVAPDATEHPPDAAPPVDPSAWVFDPTVVRDYRITADPEDLAWLDANALLEEYIPASIEIDGEAYPLGSMRYKGSSGTLRPCFTDGVRNDRCDKLSIKLAFDQIEDEGKFRGLKKVNLHAMRSDRTKMHDALGYRLFREAGVPAPRTSYARVFVNDELIGLYVVVENVDGRFTRKRFPDGGEGNLYKEVWLDADHDAEEYLESLVTNEDEEPTADKIVRFNDAVRGVPDDAFVATLASWTDLDAFVAYHAVARLIDHWDDLVTFYCWSPSGRCVNHNYYWYESTAEDKLWLIAWDLDHTFEEPSPLRTYYGMPDWDEVDASCEWFPMSGGVMARAPACDPFLRRVVTHLWPEYQAVSQALLQGPFSPLEMNARIDQLVDLLEEYVDEDPDLDLGRWEDEVDELRDDVDAKRSFIWAKM